MSLQPHFRDMLSELSAAKAQFLIVGAYALAALGVPRATGDIDIWVRPERENARRVYGALRRFGAPLTDLTEEDLATEGVVFQIGLPPNRIDILTKISGVDFAEAWTHRLKAKLDDLEVFTIGREEFLRNKKAAGRPKDLADVAYLEAPSQDRVTVPASSSARKAKEPQAKRRPRPRKK